MLNVSILDGWWDEGYKEERGWQIGNGKEYEDLRYQDAIESQALYNVLENEVIPCFYDRKNSGPPTCWMKKMKASMKMAMESFCSLRMALSLKIPVLPASIFFFSMSFPFLSLLPPLHSLPLSLLITTT